MCSVCNLPGIVSDALGACVRCIRAGNSRALRLARTRHQETRRLFGLPASPPDDEGGVPCPLCVNLCCISEGEKGYCGTRRNDGGHLKHLWGTTTALLDWYYDPLPTNCVAAWVCGLRGADYRNLAVFFSACSFDCLFCQNWHFKDWSRQPRSYTPAELASLVDEATLCVCYFGGDPSPQAPFSILSSKRAIEDRKDVRICWETNGSENPSFMNTMAHLALRSGGIIKVDLKAIDPKLHLALTGSSNEWTLENRRRLAALVPQRPQLPLLTVSTLLGPGYVDEEEVEAIARYLAQLDPDIPYSLLAFYTQYVMNDSPATSRAHAEACCQVAVNAGLRRVRVGNVHLLW